MKPGLLLICLMLAATAVAQSSPCSVFLQKKPAPTSSDPVPEILWWTCNEGSGTNIAGAASNGGDSGGGDMSWVTGASGSGSGLSFDGTSQESATLTAIDLLGTNKATICFWLKIVNTSGSKMVFETENPNLANGRFSVYQSTSQLRCFFKAGTSIREEGVTLFATLEWHHVLIVVDGTTTSGDVKFFFDGVEQTSTVYSSGNATATFTSNKGYCGARSLSSLKFNGSIDDIRIYLGDRSADVATIYANPQ